MSFQEIGDILIRNMQCNVISTYIQLLVNKTKSKLIPNNQESYPNGIALDKALVKSDTYI